MIVTLVAVRVMQVSVYQVVHVVAVRHGLGAASGTMHVTRIVR